jgi:hypothetical protein
MINVTVNGKPRQLADATELMAFLKDMKVNFKFLLPSCSWIQPTEPCGFGNAPNP